MPAPSPTVNRRWILRRRPEGEIRDGDLELVEDAVPEPGDGEAVVRTLYLSLDPTNRIWMNAADSYLPAVPLDGPMRGLIAGRVVASRADSLPEGTLVSGLGSWVDYAALPARGLNPLPAPVVESVGLPAMLSVLGLTGLTAYFGLLEVGKPKEGETVLVSGAAGATGSVAGQIAKIHGCRVVGTAGTADKCRWLTEELGFDAAVDYRTEELGPALAAACPDGIDVFFDNVGGAVLDAALARLAMHGRVVLCGAISQYNATEPPPGPRNYLSLLMNRGRMEGFIVSDHFHRAPEAVMQLAGWVQEGKIRWKVDVVDGLEHALSALGKLFDGTNRGKLMVRVAPESEIAGAGATS